MAHPKLTGRRCECTACGDLFNSDSAFDRHRVGDLAGLGGASSRRCLTEPELLASGWSRNGAGAWITRPFLALPDSHKRGAEGDGATYLSEMADDP
jgi:hypothetical protein